METICRITDKLIVILHDQYDDIFYVSGFRYFAYYQAKVTLGGVLQEIAS
ncbi:MAG TPA: hypothetical protein VEH06_10955 [Candidatus Bathyarchaeia archaeon]|jgi:hypothetical protein|nr:hypothetical protein [Candidatus Bathyarchaeia archaeon]